MACEATSRTPSSVAPGRPTSRCVQPQRDLGQRIEFVLGQHVVAFADRARDRVVDRQQADVGPAAQHGVGDRAKRGASQRLERDAAASGVRLEHDVGIRALDAFEGGGHGQGGALGGPVLRLGGRHRVSITEKRDPSHRRGALAAASWFGRYGIESARRREIAQLKKPKYPKPFTSISGGCIMPPRRLSTQRPLFRFGGEGDAVAVGADLALDHAGRTTGP